MDYLSYSGPDNNKGGGNSRLLIFMAGMLILMTVMQLFMPKPEVPPAQEASASADSAAKLADVDIKVKYDIAPRTLETDAYALTLTNIGGGRVESFIIKDPDRYFTHGDFIRSQKPDADIEGKKEKSETDEPREPAKITQGGILPLEVQLKNFGIQSETQFQTVSSADDHKQVKFTYTDPTGVYQFDKTFTTTDTPYVVHARFSLTNRAQLDISDELDISMFIRQFENEKPGLFTPGSFVAAKCYADGDMEYVDSTDKDENETYNKSLKWFGIDESYFAIAMTTPYASSCELRNDDGLLKSTLKMPVTIAAGTTANYDFDIFIGPKEAKYLDVLSEDTNLPAIIDYGWIEVLAKPMAWILDKFHELTGNWGLAIILLTLIVRFLLWPVAQKSQLSMMRMSKIAPLMQEIQEKYKDDPATLQQKQRELYQTHKINPFGCLPLLLQMPIFFALYRCIFVTGGLYHAPFYFWIDDLSAPDPYFVLPILAVGLLVLQQLLTPSTTKNTQQRIMMISMPLIFGLMMLFLPSGLCIYMVVSSAISMGQSFYVRRLVAREESDNDGGSNGPDANGVIDVESLSSKDKRAAKRREAEA